MKMVEKGMKVIKKNVAKFLLLSSLLGGMAIAHPVSQIQKLRFMSTRMVN